MRRWRSFFHPGISHVKSWYLPCQVVSNWTISAGCCKDIHVTRTGGLQYGSFRKQEALVQHPKQQDPNSKDPQNRVPLVFGNSRIEVSQTLASRAWRSLGFRLEVLRVQMELGVGVSILNFCAEDFWATFQIFQTSNFRFPTITSAPAPRIHARSYSAPNPLNPKP